jgi:tRNA threonylcarbamoyladenosine biosynthesis protein TsaE
MGNREFITISTSVDQTRKIGQTIGQCLSSGMLLAFSGDLGSGKTAFVQGLAKGLAVSEKYYITSPTYTLINEYPGRIPLFHVDLYRIEDPDDFENIGLYDIMNAHNVVAVEWAEKLPGEYLTDYLDLHFSFIDGDSRSITISARGPKAEQAFRLFEEKIQEQKWD